MGMAVTCDKLSNSLKYVPIKEDKIISEKENIYRIHKYCKGFYFF
jgi:hypothetical protein